MTHPRHILKSIRQTAGRPDPHANQPSARLASLIGCELPLHHIYTFDTTDPAFPVQIPGIRFLPLYYSFPDNAGACGYRVKSDTQIEVLYMETRKLEPDFPYAGYPPQFPERDVRLVPISYEQHKSLVYYLEAGEEALSDADRVLILENSSC